MNKARFEAFSDGVFSIAITLLVIAFALPDKLHSEGELTAALLDMWPKLIAYALSFAVIGIMWQNHHALFRLTERVDRMTVFLNFVLLGGTAFVPFATSALGEYPTMRPSAFLYGLTLSWTATAFNLILTHLVRTKAFASNVSQGTIAATVRAYRTGWLFYSTAALFALWLPVVSIAAYIALAIYFLVPRGVDADAVED